MLNLLMLKHVEKADLRSLFVVCQFLTSLENDHFCFCQHCKHRQVMAGATCASQASFFIIFKNSQMPSRQRDASLFQRVRRSMSGLGPPQRRGALGLRSPVCPLALDESDESVSIQSSRGKTVEALVAVTWHGAVCYCGLRCNNCCGKIMGLVCCCGFGGRLFEVGCSLLRFVQLIFPLFWKISFNIPCSHTFGGLVYKVKV